MLARFAKGGLGLGVGTIVFRKGEEAYWNAKEPWKTRREGAPPAAAPGAPKKKVVVLGTGWGAVAFLKGLDLAAYDVTVVSPRNYFTYTPLLPSATVGTVESRSIVESIRSITRFSSYPLRQRLRWLADGALPAEPRFLEMEATEVDPAAKTVRVADTSGVQASCNEATLGYDYLVYAVGADNNTFGTKGVEENCIFLKELDDVRRIRNVVLDNFETAALPCTSAAERARLLHFVVVGGGPTGVEFAAELEDYLRSQLVCAKGGAFYKDAIDLAKVTLVQSAEHCLNTFHADIAAFTDEHLRSCGVDLRTGQRVKEVTPAAIVCMDKKTKRVYDIPYGLCVWSTGVGPRALTKALISKVPAQSNYRALNVDPNLAALGMPGVFVVGDAGTVKCDKLQAHLEELWLEALQGHRQVDKERFCAILHSAAHHYPQAITYANKAAKHFDEHVKAGQQMDKATFCAVLEQLDRKTRSLPPTAQVAQQQGSYLAASFNAMAEGAQDTAAQDCFAYQDNGMMAYIGSETAVMAYGGSAYGCDELSGKAVGVVWHAAYWGMLESARMMCLVPFDWAKCAVFGRDSSRA